MPIDRKRTLLVRWPLFPLSFDGGALTFRFQPAATRRRRRPCGAARDRGPRRTADQFDQALERVLAVALLGPVALGGDEEHALLAEPSAGQPLQPRADVARQRRRAADVEAQLHRRCQLVDVLPAGTGGAHEALLDL